MRTLQKMVLTMGIICTGLALANDEPKMMHSSMSAQFEQLSYDAEGNLMEKVTGELTMKFPKKFHWQSITDHGRVEMISDGHDVYQYDEDLNQVVHYSSEQFEKETPIYIISTSMKDLSKYFTVEDHQRHEHFLTLTLQPKWEDTLMDHVVLEYTDEGIHRVNVFMKTGSRVSLKLSDVAYENGVSDSAFKYVIPAGADVIEQGG